MTTRRVCLAAALFALAACDVGSPWPGYGGDLQGRWEARPSSSSAVSSTWSISASELGLDLVHSCPTISADNKLVAASAGTVFAIDPKTHNVGIIGQISDSVIRAVNMYQLQPIVSVSSGRVRKLGVGGWDTAIDGRPSAPTTNGESVFVSAGSSIYAMDGATGQVTMKTDVGDQIVSPGGPAIAPEGGEVAVVVATLNGHVVKIVPGTGAIKWNIQIGGARFNSGVSIALNGTIFVRSWEGRLYVIGRNGNQLANFDSGTSDPTRNGKGSLDGPAVSTMGNSAVAYVVDQTPKLTAISDQGQVLWQRTLPDRPTGGTHPVAAGDAVYIQLGAGPNTKLVAVTRDSTRWSVDVGWPTCLAAGRDGYLYGVSGSSIIRIIKIG